MTRARAIYTVAVGVVVGLLLIAAVPGIAETITATYAVSDAGCSGHTRIEVEKQVDGSAFTPAPGGVLLPGQGQFLDATLTVGRIYGYRARCVNDFGASPYNQPSIASTTGPGGQPGTGTLVIIRTP